MRGRQRIARCRLDGRVARLDDSSHLEDRCLLSGLLGMLAPVVAVATAPESSGGQASILGDVLDPSGPIDEHETDAPTGGPLAGLFGVIGEVGGLAESLTTPVTDLVDDLGVVVASTVTPATGLIGEVGGVIDSALAPVVALEGGAVGVIADPKGGVDGTVGLVIGTVGGVAGQVPTTVAPAPPAGGATTPADPGGTPYGGTSGGGVGVTVPIVVSVGSSATSSGSSPTSTSTPPTSAVGSQSGPTIEGSTAGGGTTFASTAEGANPGPTAVATPSRTGGASTPAATTTTTAVPSDARAEPTGTARAPGSQAAVRDGMMMAAASGESRVAASEETEARAIEEDRDEGGPRADRAAAPGITAPGTAGSDAPAGVLAPPIEQPIIRGEGTSQADRGDEARREAIAASDLAEMPADDLPLLERALNQLVEEIEGLGRAFGDQLDELATSPWLLVPAVGSAAIVLARLRHRQRGRRLRLRGGPAATWSPDLSMSLT